MFKMKSKMSFVVAALVFVGSLAGVHASQSPAKIKNVRQEITISQEVKVGTTVLKSGQYLVTSKDQELTFRRLMEDPAYGGQMIVDNRVKPVVVKATPTVLDAKSRGTLLDMPADGAGVHVLKAITLDDTNVKFTIE